ncbi:exported protein, unknown function [Hepatocystis sp. ex Piliocolobus tephrosceles]|nr:exported protein, unknown function [Hepatocystis sp. ex Piliocolobus tephrosceles]
MLTNICKIISICFLAGTCINNSKTHSGNIFSTKNNRSLAQCDTFTNQRNDHFYITKRNDIINLCDNLDQYIIIDHSQNTDIFQIEKLRKKKKNYLTDLKEVLITQLDEQCDPPITNILKKDTNIKKKNLLNIYDSIKYVISSEQYLQMINESYELLKKKNSDDNDDAENYYNSILYLLNTYFFFTNNKTNFNKRFLHLQKDKCEEPIFKKKKFKFKAKYLNILKFNNKINKQIKNMLLKQVIKKKIDSNVEFSYKENFKLHIHVFFYPILVYIILVSTMFLGSLNLILALVSLFLLAYAYSIFKRNRYKEFIKKITQGLKLVNREYFI